MTSPIYLDYQSTTPVDPRALEVMLPYFTEHFANPASSTHQPGMNAEAAVKNARETIADALGAKPKEIIFTSGATEALNLGIKGIAEASGRNGQHLITVATEHHAVLDTYRHLAERGLETTVLPVCPDGLVSVDAVSEAIRDDTILVSVMMANNEIGTIQPIEEIASLCRERGIFFLTDATQALGKWPINVSSLGIDMLVASAHKIYGPKGVGFLYAKSLSPKVPLTAQLHGGGQERALRSGTVNVPGIVGMAKALELATTSLESEQAQLKNLRDHLHQRLLADVPDVTINGTMGRRLANNLSVRIDGIDAQAIMLRLRSELAVSSGSACTSRGTEPSHVLSAIGLTEREAHSSLRFGIGRFTTQEEIDAAVELLATEIRQAREFAMQ